MVSACNDPVPMNPDSTSEDTTRDVSTSADISHQPDANAAPAVADIEDDFADVELGERQPEVCTMEEGCTSGCQ